MADDGVVLRPQLNAGYVLDPHDPTIWRSADDDLFKLLRRNETALCSDRVCKFLTLGCGFAANLAGRIHRILGLERSHNFWNCDRELCQLIRLYPQSHRVPARSKHLNTADSVNAAQLIVKIDVCVVRQELRVIDTARRVETDQHQRRSDG